MQARGEWQEAMGMNRVEYVPLPVARHPLPV